MCFIKNELLHEKKLWKLLYEIMSLINNILFRYLEVGMKKAALK